MSRILRLAVALLVFCPFLGAPAEQVAKLPAPTDYVSDLAGVLSDSTRESLDALCLQVDQQAHAQIAVVTVKTIEDDKGGEESIEEFTTALEEKWKVGAKGTDRGVLMLFVTGPTKGRIEVGYGLEGILNDAKVGDIGRTMAPAAKAGDYNTAIPLGVQEIAQDIAADAGISLNQRSQVHQYHYQQAAPVHVSIVGKLIGGGLLLLIVIILISTGNAGWLFFLLANILGGGGGGGGGGRDDNDRGGGGFGGFGGGSSGGGGASGDW